MPGRGCSYPHVCFSHLKQTTANLSIDACNDRDRMKCARNTQCGLRRLRERELAGKNNSKIMKIRLNKNRVGEDDWLAIPTPFFQNRVMPIQILSPGGNNIESDHYGSRALMRPCISAGCPLGCPVAASRASNPCAEVPAHPLSPERGASQSAKEEKKRFRGGSSCSSSPPFC